MSRTRTKCEADTIPVELLTQQMAELYWLAFLITGDRDQSIGAFTDAVRFDEPAPTSRRSMLSWARTLIIVAALDAVRSQPRDSQQGTQIGAENCNPSRGLVATPLIGVQQLTKSDLEQSPSCNRYISAMCSSFDLFGRSFRK